MPLDACIAKVGTLSENDIAFLRKEILDGSTDEQAIANLEVLVEQEAEALVARIEEAGGTIEREAPPVDRPDAAEAASLENNIKLAEATKYNTNRELKEVMQANVLQAYLESQGFEDTGTLEERTADNAAHLAAVGTADAIFALQDNADAVGWYDRTVSKALEVLGTIHPEILTDPNARFAFTFALAVTSNGMKVDNNFKMAEAAYRAYKKDGKMPNNIGEGTAGGKMNEHMDLFNKLVDEMGLENFGAMFQSQFTVAQLKRMDLDPGGELVDTVVYGAAVLGPKIGNGFFMNLNGEYDQLTMDRWLMRTWGRWTGSLIKDRPDLVEAKVADMEKKLTRMSKASKAWGFFQKTLDMDLTNHGKPGGPTYIEIAQRIQLKSVNPDSRSDMNRTVIGSQLRKLGNGLAKDVDGQKEAPQNGTERNWIRGVFTTILENMHNQGYTDMTMADLQALLWYPEKRLYDKAKSEEDVANGYDLDEAPDYANAAAKLAKARGIKPAAIKSAQQRAEQQHADQVSAGRAAGELPAQAAEGQPAAARGLARKERSAFLRRNILVPNRVSRSDNEKAKSYTAPSRGTLGNVLGVIHKPRQDYSNELAAAEVTPMTMVEMEATPENADLFAQSIQNIKDAHPEGAAVYVYPTDEYAGMKLFVNEDQTAGFAVKADGDIVSVFAAPNRDEPGRVYSMLALAVERAGGTKLDAFDTILPQVYAMAGFVEVGRDPWVEKFKPADWDKATFIEYNNGEPDIVYMEYQNAVPEYFAQSDVSKDEALIEIDNALEDGSIKITQAEAEALVEMGFTHPDVRRTEDDKATEAAARSPEEAAQAREDYAAATSRTDSEVSAEFARAKRGEAVTFLHRSHVAFSHFDDGYLGGNTGRPTAHLGHFLTAMSYDAPEFGDNLVTVTFQFKKPLVISSEEFVAMGDRSIQANKQDRLDLMAQGYDGILVDGLEWAIAFEGKNLTLAHDTSGLEWMEAEVEKGEGFLEQPDRGRYYPDVSGKRIIQLTQAADLSTFLHETGHMFLDIQRVWVEKYGINENQQAMLDWLGVESFEDITREQHETWAETFEVYLREGKAPSIGLRRAFASFTSWLKRLYRTLSDPRLTRAKMSPEITEIFDRMLATEAEIDLAASTPEYGELFQSQEQAGMTDEQWKKYKKLAERKNKTAEATLDAKVMKQYKQMKSKEWAAEKAPLVEAEVERLGQEPIHQAIAEMSTDEGKVDWHMLRDAIGGWPNGKNWIGKAVGGGQDPGLVAEKYGFASVKDMYEQVKESPTMKQASEQAAEEIMVQRHGDILNDGTLEQEVREAMLNDDQAELLLMELKAENRKAPKINRKNLQHEAELLIGTYTYKEIRPNKFYNQMIKAAKAAAAAVAKGEDATPHKIQQLANHYLYRAAMDARTKMEKSRKFVKAVQKRIEAGKMKPTQVDLQYIQAMANLSKAYDMRLKPEERAQYARNVMDFFEAQTNPENKDEGDLVGLEMLDPNVIAAIQFRHKNGTLEGFELKTFDEMTVGEMKGVVLMLEHLRYVGGQIASKGSEEAADMREAGLESIDENGGKDYPVSPKKVRAGKIARLTWGDYWASLPSIVNMVRKMDGFKDGGWAFENILKPLQAAVDKKFELQMQMFKQMETFMSGISGVGLRQDDALPFTTEDGLEQEYTSEEIFMLAVYWGTESSRAAVMEGHEINENDAMALMERLTPEQLELANQVWAMNESQWPDLARTAKAMMGVAPPKLMATPFTVNGVQMTGGHMQLMYTSQSTQLADEQERGMRTSNVVPMAAGSTHARKGSGGRVVNLDASNISMSIEDKTQYIAFSEAGRHLRSILNNREIQDMIVKKHGAPYYRNLVHAVAAVAAAQPAQESSQWIARASKWVRQSATLMHLAYSFRNVAQQPAAAAASIREVGIIPFIQGVGMFGSNYSAMTKMIKEKSKFMENRADLVNREARETMKKVMATTKFRITWRGIEGQYWNAFKSYGFIMQTMVDSAVAYPTWYAKYNLGIEAHGDEARAVIEADSAVAESVGSGSDLHLGRLLQSNQTELVKSMTVFQSWFNAYYQRLYKSSKGGETFLNPAFLMEAVVLPIIIANLTQLAIGDWPDEEEEWHEWATKNYLKFMIATLPLVREAGSVWEGFTPTSPITTLVTAPFRLESEIDSYLEGRQTLMKLMSDVGKTVTSVVPAPGSGNIWRVIEYTDSFNQGKEGDIYNPYLAFTEGADKDK
jgi:ADP-ribose pyrophosphatase YjhB (NUDIX family)